MSTSPPPTNSYMITSRAEPTSLLGQDPLSGNELWWYESTSPNDTDYEHFNANSRSATTAPPTSFTADIQAQLGAQTKPSLTIFIHGLDCFWKDAVLYTGQLGANLAQAGYEGLVIGFSWPSNGPDDLVHYATGYPPQAKQGTVRGNILLSVGSFGSLMSWLRELASAVSGLGVNFVCHSEGNYMLMCGLQAQTVSPTGAPLISQTLMIAADINDGAFLTPATGLVGQAANVALLSSRVTVYYSSNDPILGFSEGAFGAGITIPVLGTIGGPFHNPSFGGRLGLGGPSYNQGPQQPAMVSVDASPVVNETNVASLDFGELQDPPASTLTGVGLHTSYLYIPQVLADFVATLSGQAASTIPHRSATSTSGNYAMSLSSTSVATEQAR